MKKKLGGFIIISMLILGIVPYIWAAVYTIPGIDDLTNAVTMRNISGGYLTKAFIYTINTYFSWQGTYFSILLIGLFRPYDSFGLTGLHIHSVSIILLLFFSTILVLFIILHCQYERKSARKKAVLYGVGLLFIILNVNNHVEFLFFNNANYVYTIPLIIAEISLALMIRCYVEVKYKIKFIFAIILGILV